MKTLKEAIQDDKRVRVIIGHYGSGKTEFSVNYALELADISDKKVAISDLDVVNPYFRSRERAGVMEEKGIRVLSSILGNNVNLDLPSIDPAIFAPLQDDSYELILDVGGDHVGATILAQFREYLDDVDMFAVVNTNRPETMDEAGIIKHIKAIENTAKRSVTGIIVNTHLLWDTTPEDVIKGVEITEPAAASLGIPIKYISAYRPVAEALEGKLNYTILPVDMHMRDKWM